MAFNHLSPAEGRLALLLSLALPLALAMGCVEPDDDTTTDDDDGVNDDDDSVVDPTPYAFSVAAPVALEGASVDGFVCDVTDGIADCEVNRVVGALLKGDATNYLFVDLETTISEAAEVVLDGEVVCDLSEEEDCVVYPWQEDYQFCLAPQGMYANEAGSPREVETNEVDGECQLSFLFNACEFPVADNEFSGICGTSTIDVGTISDDLEEIYYHVFHASGDEFEETLYRQ